jgi:choice-of-anchor C domain-containing protein
MEKKMRRLIVSLSVVFVLVIAIHQVRATSLIVNGSFESGPAGYYLPGYITLPDGDASITGWVVKTPSPGGNIDYVSTYWQSSDGQHSLDLNGTETQGPGGIAQTFSTEPGQFYTVTFDIASNPTIQDFFPVKIMEVSAAGQSQQFSVDSTGHTNQSMGWESHTWSFQSTDYNTQLWFYMISPNYGNEGIGVDNISVTAVPEPSTLVLLGMGIVSLLACAWRRHNK